MSRARRRKLARARAHQAWARERIRVEGRQPKGELVLAPPGARSVGEPARLRRLWRGIPVGPPRGAEGCGRYRPDPVRRDRRKRHGRGGGGVQGAVRRFRETMGAHHEREARRFRRAQKKRGKDG